MLRPFVTDRTPLPELGTLPSGVRATLPLTSPSELNLPQKIPSPLFVALLVPQAEG